MDQTKRALRRIIALSIAAAVLAVPSFAEKVLIAGDSRNDTRGVLPEIVKQSNKIPNLALFMHLGDMTGGASEKEFENYNATIAKVKVPVVAIAGNHERGRDTTRYERMVGPAYFTKQVGRWRFIFLDNSRKTLGDIQWSWLKRELVDAKSAHEYVAIAVHKPLWCPPAGGHVMENPERERVLSLVESSGVKVVLGAHWHNYFRGAKNKVVHVTTGGAGAPLVGDKPFFHYIIGDFRDDGTFDLKVVKINK